MEIPFQPGYSAVETHACTGFVCLLESPSPNCSLVQAIHSAQLAVNEEYAYYSELCGNTNKDNTSAKHGNYKCNNGNAEIFVECSADITYEQKHDDVDVLSDTNVNDNVGCFEATHDDSNSATHENSYYQCSNDDEEILVEAAVANTHEKQNNANDLLPESDVDGSVLHLGSWNKQSKAKETK